MRGRQDLRVLTPKRRTIQSAAEALEIALRAGPIQAMALELSGTTSYLQATSDAAICGK